VKEGGAQIHGFVQGINIFSADLYNVYIEYGLHGTIYGYISRYIFY